MTREYTLEQAKNKIYLIKAIKNGKNGFRGMMVFPKVMIGKRIKITIIK